MYERFPGPRYPTLNDRMLSYQLRSYGYRSTGWVRGRQGGGYLVLPIPKDQEVPSWMKRLTQRSLALIRHSALCGGTTDKARRLGEWDRYIIQYPEGSGIPEHTDPVAEGMQHIRLNSRFGAPCKGGEFSLCGDVVPMDDGESILFRPDRDAHSVSTVTEGCRWVWSVGATVPQR